VKKNDVLKRKICVKAYAFGKKQYFHSLKQNKGFPSNEVKT